MSCPLTLVGDTLANNIPELYTSNYVLPRAQGLLEALEGAARQFRYSMSYIASLNYKALLLCSQHQVQVASLFFCIMPSVMHSNKEINESFQSSVLCLL